jgi:hypothetical protein
LYNLARYQTSLVENPETLAPLEDGIQLNRVRA